MAPTLEDVARLAGVSRSTVSRVINRHPNVRPEVRERVWKAIRECGYQPHALARGLATRQTRIFGVVIPEAVSRLFTDPFFPLLIRGATKVCNVRNYQLMLSLFDDAAHWDEMYQRVVLGGYLDGVVVASAGEGDPLIESLLRDRIPMVSVGRHPDPRVHYVDVDNVGGARMAVEHLIRLGHRRIGIITGRLDLVASKDRLEGYRQALGAHGLPVEEDLIVEGDYTERSGMAGAQQLLAAKPTAIFASSDSMAIGALKLLRRLGIRVPEDIALVGYDDVTTASAVVPPLTTVRQPIERLGSMAVEILIDLLEGTAEEDTAVHRIVLSTELVVRSSCGAMLGTGA